MKSLLTLKPYFLKYRRTLALGLIFILLSTVFQILAPLFVRYAIDDLQAKLSTSSLLTYAAMITAVAALSGLFLYLTRQTIIVVSRRVEYDLRNDFLRRIQKLSLRYFQHTPTGDIMALATNDINAIRMFVGPAVMYSADTAFTSLITLAMMFSIHPLLTLYALIPLPLISYGVNVLGKKIHDRFEDIQSHYSKLTMTAQENLSGMHVVKAYVREAHEVEKFRSLSRQYVTKNLWLAKVQAFMMPALALLVGISIVVVVWIGGLEVIAKRLSLGELTQLIMYLGMLIWPMIAIGWVINIIQRAAASSARVNRMLALEPEIEDSEATDRTITTLRGDITFENVSMTFDERTGRVLSNVSLDIPHGSTLAIVGHTGAGKSTLVNLLPRLFDATEGKVCIDGRDVRTIPLATLRECIGFVTQETFLFSDTIEHNIAYGVDAYTMGDVHAAASIAQLEKDVEYFPRQYSTLLGERGITLSGGQKQRTSIARALMRNPTILILDDALSAVDTHTEEEILTRLRSFMKERTSIIISHRVSTVKEADCIIVLANGAIAERGTHDELVARGGIYAELHYKQLLASEIEAME